MPTKHFRRFVAYLALAIFSSQAQSAPPRLAGQQWQLGSDGPVISFETCGAALCGRIVSLPGWKGAATDVKNPDPAKRNRPLCGLLVLTGLVANNTKWTGGKFYAPPRGMTLDFGIEAGAGGPVGIISGMLPFSIRKGFLPVTASTPRTCAHT